MRNLQLTQYGEQSNALNEIQLHYFLYVVTTTGCPGVQQGHLARGELPTLYYSAVLQPRRGAL